MTSFSDLYSGPEPAFILHGNHTQNDHRINLRAGVLSMIYENGSLRYISAGGIELIRMICSSVRDRDWLTLEPVITGEKFDIKPDSFRIEYNCLYRSSEIEFSALYTIIGDPDSTLIFRFEGEALNTFEKSRIGFCILHPLEGNKGNPCLITHSDGSTETLEFSVFISPDQLFTDIKAMRWNIKGSECILNFSGEVFETEDQRNWTDASYKTYCTPLSVPYPVKVMKGEKISQRIGFRAEAAGAEKKADSEEIILTIDPLLSFDIPLIGIGHSTRQSPLTINETEILRNLAFNHYRADIYLFSAGWTREADLAAREAVALNYSLELALFFDNNFPRQIEEFTGWLATRKPAISVISILHKSQAVTPHELLNNASPKLKQILPDVMIACGTNANFAQLNRNVPEAAFADMLCYSIHPQEHASDNTTLVENLQAQACSVESARQFTHGKAIWISPVNLQRRFNANIENYETPVSGDRYPPQADSRIMSLFGACWTAGSLKYLGESGVKGITYFETAGERGIIQGDYDSRWPDHFKTKRGMIFPVYHLFSWLLNDRSFRLISCISTRPLEVDCLALSNGEQIKLSLVNFSSQEKKVDLRGVSGEIRFKRLNAESFFEAAADPGWIEKDWDSGFNPVEPIGLEPYSLNFIEGYIINHRSCTE